jgi:hypothetical protein
MCCPVHATTPERAVAVPSGTLYQPRQPQATQLYRLVESHYADVRDAWEERFEGRYGFWRAVTDRAVGAHLDCGILDHGFARVRCGACRAEDLVAFSCKVFGTRYYPLFAGGLTCLDDTRHRRRVALEPGEALVLGPG